jgi:hypothetical protein
MLAYLEGIDRMELVVHEYAERICMKGHVVPPDEPWRDIFLADEEALAQHKETVHPLKHAMNEIWSASIKTYRGQSDSDNVMWN